MTLPKIVSEFRRGLENGELLIQQCADCDVVNMYPRYACPACQSEKLTWKNAKGTGVLHSYCVLRAGAPEGFESDLPYALGVIKLDEGVQMLARLAPEDDGDWSNYKCDDKVEFTATPPTEVGRRPCATFRRVGA